jgi:protein-S-isoprenylcysteine O-methyltransferase Ste14
MSSHVFAAFGRRISDLVLVGVTSLELLFLFRFTPAFTVTDWIYVSHRLAIIGIGLVRSAPRAQDRSLAASVAVVVAYGYPYAQVLLLGVRPGIPGWPAVGLVTVTVAAALSLVCLVTLGKRFGIRPAWRGLTTRGPYAVVRHPMYLSYLVADVGYNLQEWNGGTILLTLAGWAALLYRIRAEEKILSLDPSWPLYTSEVRYRLLPGVW